MTSTISLRHQRIKQDGAILLARRAMGEKWPPPPGCLPFRPHPDRTPRAGRLHRAVRGGVPDAAPLPPIPEGAVMPWERLRRDTSITGPCPDVVSIQLGRHLAQVDREEADEEGFEAFKADADLAAILDTDALLWALYHRDLSEDEVRAKIESALREAYAGQLARRAEEEASDRYDLLRQVQTFCF